jgi:hypothetical protein
MRGRFLSAAVATGVAISGWTAVSLSTAEAAERAVPHATCAVSEGPGGLFGVSGTGFEANELIYVYGSDQRKVRETRAIAGGFFEVTGLPNDTYRIDSFHDGNYRMTVCPKFVSDEEAAITCTVTKGPGQTYRVSGRGFPEAETVTLRNSQGAVVDTALTIKDGFFEFTGVPNDTYTVTSKFAKTTCPQSADPGMDTGDDTGTDTGE